MRILIDESLPRDLKNEFPGHDATTVADRGWAGKKNGELLRLVSAEFEVLITGDRNMQYQQPIAKTSIRLIVLVANDTKIRTLLPLIPRVLELLSSLQPGTVTEIRADRHNGRTTAYEI